MYFYAPFLGVRDIYDTNITVDENNVKFHRLKMLTCISRDEQPNSEGLSGEGNLGQALAEPEVNTETETQVVVQSCVSYTQKNDLQLFSDVYLKLNSYMNLRALNFMRSKLAAKLMNEELTLMEFLTFPCHLSDQNNFLAYFECLEENIKNSIFGDKLKEHVSTIIVQAKNVLLICYFLQLKEKEILVWADVKDYSKGIAGNYTRYDTNNTLDFIRMMRNIKAHFRELDERCKGKRKYK